VRLFCFMTFCNACSGSVVLI